MAIPAIPASRGLTMSTFGTSGITAANGDVLVCRADYACWNETASSFVNLGTTNFHTKGKDK